jgi:hypothetical protein
MSYFLSIRTDSLSELVGTVVNGPSGPDMIVGSGSGYVAFLPGHHGNVAYGASGNRYQLALISDDFADWFEIIALV